MKKNYFCSKKQFTCALLVKIFFFVILLSMYCSSKLTAQNQSHEIKNDIVLFSNSLAINSSSALFYIRRADAKSVALKNDSLLARTSYNLGYYYYLKNNVDSAHIYLKKGLEFAPFLKT